MRALLANELAGNRDPHSAWRDPAFLSALPQSEPAVVHWRASLVRQRRRNLDLRECPSSSLAHGSASALSAAVYAASRRTFPSGSLLCLRRQRPQPCGPGWGACSSATKSVNVLRYFTVGRDVNQSKMRDRDQQLGRRSNAAAHCLRPAGKVRNTACPRVSRQRAAGENRRPACPARLLPAYARCGS